MATQQADQKQRAAAPPQIDVKERERHASEADARRRLLAGIPVTERRLEPAGIPTAVLEGGEGSPIVLLHGPGESAANWRWVIPSLAEIHRVIAPDLPAHGSTEAPDDVLDADRVLRRLDGLIEHTRDSPSALVGHALGGAIATRFAIEAGDRLSNLVLVDSLGVDPSHVVPLELP